MIPITAVMLIAVGCLAAGCTTARPTWQHASDRDHAGRIYYYERTNVDGTRGERITVFRRSVDEIEVYKAVELCQNAALVTARLDFETFSASDITGGRLLPDAEVMEFAFLDWDRASSRLGIRVAAPDFELREEVLVEHTPWHLFDFDLASLTVMTPHLTDPRADFGFGMALVWADFDASDPLTWMGDVNATHVGTENRGDVWTNTYVLSGSALTNGASTGREGRLWLDAADGHVVDAIFPAPNHPGYDDFRLRLIRVSDGGADEWGRLLRAHFESCS